MDEFMVRKTEKLTLHKFSGSMCRLSLSIFNNDEHLQWLWGFDCVEHTNELKEQVHGW